MTKQLLRFLPFIILFINCEREKLYVDPDYPSTYFKIPTDILLSRRTALESNYPYLKTSVDQFGFCFWPNDYKDTNPPANSDLLTDVTATSLAKKFISEYPEETGITNPEDVVIAAVYPLSDGIHWVIVTSNQKVNDTEVLNTEVVIKITNGVLVSCEGNWFPEIYIPDKFNFDESRVKTHLIGQVVTHTNIGGDKFNVTITKQDIISISGELKVVPVRTDNRIELRLTWMFNIPSPVHCKVYADVMTGEIILQEPGIIS